MSRIPQLRADLVEAAARRYQPAAETNRTNAINGAWLKAAHRRRWLAVAGGVVAAGLAAAGLFSFQGDGFAPTSAVAAMDGLAHIAASREWAGVPGPGQYVYTDSTRFSHWYVTRDGYGGYGFRPYPLGSGPQCTVNDMTHTQDWMAADGSGAETNTEYGFRFAPAAAKATCAAIGVTDPRVGNPHVPSSLAKIARPHTQLFPANPGNAYVPGIGELPFGGDDWKTLSSNPATLLKQLAHHDHGLVTDNTPAGEFNAVADFMSESDAPPRVRSNVFEAAKLIPGIKLMGTRTDPTGQTGIAVRVDHIYGNGKAVRAVSEELIFDPQTARLLATEEFIDKNRHLVSWQSYKQPKIVDSATRRPWRSDSNRAH
jgi:hypothetical protein